jgi:hypothetical protein
LEVPLSCNRKYHIRTLTQRMQIQIHSPIPIKVVCGDSDSKVLRMTIEAVITSGSKKPGRICQGERREQTQTAGETKAKQRSMSGAAVALPVARSMCSPF